MIDDMAVYIANLGKYNEGYLVGAWFTFPPWRMASQLSVSGVKAIAEPEQLTKTTFLPASFKAFRKLR